MCQIAAPYVSAGRTISRVINILILKVDFIKVILFSWIGLGSTESSKVYALSKGAAIPKIHPQRDSYGPSRHSLFVPAAFEWHSSLLHRGHSLWPREYHSSRQLT